VIRVAVQLDGYPPHAVHKFAEDMYEHLLLTDSGADMSGPDEDIWTFWSEVTSETLELAVTEGVGNVRRTAVAAAQQTSTVNHNMWPEHAVATAVEGYAASSLAG
jgi:hypothetical protein